MGKYGRIVMTAVIALFFLPQAALANAPYVTFTFDDDGLPVQTQSAYVPAGVIDGFRITETDENGETRSVPLSGPEDLFIDARGDVYVADTGNARIVVFDVWGNYKRTIGQGVLARPTGVFVDDEGTVYVADYRNEKVYLFDKDGTLRQEIGRPASRLFGANQPFKPVKIVADKRQNMYVVGEGTVHGLIQINKQGEFLGYFGGNKAGFNLTRYLQRLLYTKEQLDKLMRQLPPSATNVAIDREGLVYTGTAGVRMDGIKKLNVAGKNLLSNVWTSPSVADITVDALGNIYAVDAIRGWVVEYDPEGRILFFFGDTDTGSQRLGLFKSPSAIAVGPDGRVFVADKQRSNIQILKPTEFTLLVHEAIMYYMDGKYAESERPWQDVLRLNSMFGLAHTGLGMAALKQGDYERALAEFRLANNKEQYSNAYWEIRRIWLMEHASTAIIVIVAGITALLILEKLHRKYGILRAVANGWRRFRGIRLVSQLLHTFRLMRHPVDGYWELEAEGKASVFSATVLLVLLFAVRLVVLYQTNFLFADWDVRKISLFNEVLTVYVPFFAWVICNYLVSTINDGEGKFKDIYKGSVYALSPYIVFAGPLAVLSQGLTRLEQVVYEFASAAIVLYSAFLMFMMVKEIHGYEIGQSFKNIFLTLVGMAIMAVLAFILFGLSNQVTDFVYSIYQEVKFRVQDA